MYTKLRFAKDLKDKVKQKQDTILIGIWADSVYIDYEDIKDLIFLELLSSLAMMELGSEFAFSYPMLNKIADDLIVGKEIDINSPEYIKELESL
jgi:hypothetical protein